MSRYLCLFTVFLSVICFHLLTLPDSEPYFNNDETRHVMTGVFFYDFVSDPIQSPKLFATQYYLQYPALGLLIWPPLFHMTEGLWMHLFGIGFDSARSLILIHLLICIVALYGIARIYLPKATHCFYLSLIAFSPMIVQFSGQVMGEIPMFAYAMLTIYFFESYLIRRSTIFAILTCLSLAAAFLTRYDAIFLPIFLFLRLLQTNRWNVLTHREVVIGICLCLLLVLPYFALSMLEYGSSFTHAAVSGTSSTARPDSILHRLFFYPEALIEQLGLIVASLVVVAICFQRRLLTTIWFAWIASIYLAFTFLAETESRHAMYWIPAWLALLVNAVHRLIATIRWQIVFLSILLCIEGFESSQRQRGYVRGYEMAAQYCLQHSTSDRCLIDAFLNGNLIYQIRRLDISKSMQCLRGDKLLYSMRSEPSGGYEEWAKNDQEVLDRIHEMDPELIILEQPEVWFSTPGGTRLRQVIHDHPERFERVQSFAIESNKLQFQGVQLVIYRNLQRNPNRSPKIEYEMLHLQRKIQQ